MSQVRRAQLVLVMFLGLVFASIAVIMVRPTVLGLDLQGGVEVILQGKDTPEAEVNDDAIERAIEVIRNRVDRFGVSEPEIQSQGDDQIIVALPGASNEEGVVEDLIRPAQMTFYKYEDNLVGEEGTASLYQVVQRAQRSETNSTRGGPTFYLFGAEPERRLLVGPEFSREDFEEAIDQEYPSGPPAGSAREVVPRGWVIVSEERTIGGDRDGPTSTVWHLLQDNPGVFGRDVSRAYVGVNNAGIGGSQPVVQMEFNDAGADAFEDVTADLAQDGAILGVNQRFAIVLDGEIITNPTIDFRQNPSGIGGGQAQIEGNFSQGEAQALANQINSGAIPIRLDVINQQEVSATLGKESLRQGLLAGVLGLALVLTFLIAYYRVLGLVAGMALVVYALMLWAVVNLVPITLTLPGIAGIILTIGVASDTNVVIFERVREEARAGRTPRTAILNGYKKGIGAIIDANVVTIGVAAILFLFATAGVKGFAFTLVLGVTLSLFTAIVGTRAVFSTMANTRYLSDDRFMGLNQRQPSWKFDYVGRWKMWMAISFVPLVIGLGWLGVNGLNLGLDFESGSRFNLVFEEQPSEQAVRQVFTDLGYESEVQLTTQAGPGGAELEGLQITSESLQPAERDQVEAALEDQVGEFAVESFQLVGPTFGEQIIRNAIIAIILSFILMVVYLTIRFEYKLALPAILTVVHDVIMCIGIYSVTGREVTSATVAALLTILGYSLYDVVIVFDRIRENVPILRGWAYRDIVNRSIAETFTRSLITLFLTILPITMLYFFGGETLRDFAFALMVGLFSGGASSILIAGPLAALWKEREEQPTQTRRSRRERKQIINRGDADVVDLDVLARAERALAAGEGAEEAPRGLTAGADPDEPPAGDGDDAAPPDPPQEPPDRPDEKPDAPDGPDGPDAAENGDAGTRPPAAARPGSPRRHSNVRRRRRR